MRAWLLLLAVLATFLTIVQVASTEDISARFITAIKPIEGQAATRRIATTAKKQKNSSTAILKTTTALTKVFNPNFDLAATSSHSLSSPASTALSKSSKLVYKSSDTSDKHNEQESAEIIEIKSINRIQNEVNKVQKITATTDQLESSKNELAHSKNKHKKIKNENKMEINESARTNDDTHNHHHTRHHKQRKESKAEKRISTTTTTSMMTETPNTQTESQALTGPANSDEDISPAVEIIASVDVPANADAVIEEDGPATYSNQEIIKDKVKPDPSTLVEIENSLLSLFNMKRPPKIDRSKIIIPEAMKQLYAQIMGHELDSVNIPRPGLLTKSANTVRSFTHKDSKIDDRFPHHHRFRLHFDVKSIPSEEKLKAAELQLTRETIGQAALHPRQAQRTRYQVLVYDITRVGVRGKREPNYLLLDSKTVRLNSTETVSLDVQPAVDRWLATPQRNYGLLVEVRTMRSLKPAPHHHVRLRRSADEPHEKWQHKQPLLFTYTDDGRHKVRSIRDVSSRSKRAGGHHRRPYRRKNNEEICRRHSLYVDFADVGWSDWIVAPPGYDAFYCHGKCPFPLADHLNSTNHAVVQTLVNNLNPGKVPKACCVPTQLEGISMLYLNDQSTVVLKNYQDMTVVGCGCR